MRLRPGRSAGSRGAGGLADRRQQVEPVGDQPLLYPAGPPHAGAASQQRNADHLFPQGRLAVPAVGAVAVAVVGGEQDQGVVPPAGVAHRVEQAAHLGVHLLHDAEVLMPEAPPLLRRESRRRVDPRGVGLHEAQDLRAVRRLLEVGRQVGAFGQRSRLRHRSLWQRLRARQLANVVGIQEGGEEEEGPLAGPQEPGRRLGDLVVAGAAQHLQAALPRRDAGDVPLAGQGAAIPGVSQQAAQRLPVQGLPQRVVVAGDARIVRHAAGDVARPRRGAQGMRAVGPREPQPPGRQAVHARRGQVPVAGAAHGRGGLLIGADQQDIGSLLQATPRLFRWSTQRATLAARSSGSPRPKTGPSSSMQQADSYPA